MIFLLLLASASPVVATPHDIDPHDFVRVDVRGAVASIDAVADTLRALPEARRVDVAASLRELSVSDPYTRAALQLPFVLMDVVVGIPDDRFPRLVRQDWVHLQEGLSTHVAILTSLHVDLQPPVAGDPLHGRGVVMMGRDELLGSDDPLARTASLVDAIVPIAARIDAPAHQRIEALSDRVEELTGVVRPCPRDPHSILPGQPWTLGMQLGGWHDALRRVQPFVDDPAVRVQVDAMVQVLDRYGEASFVGVGAASRP